MSFDNAYEESPLDIKWDILRGYPFCFTLLKDDTFGSFLRIEPEGNDLWITHSVAKIKGFMYGSVMLGFAVDFMYANNYKTLYSTIHKSNRNALTAVKRQISLRQIEKRMSYEDLGHSIKVTFNA